jgi:hypothetical protein
MASKPITEEEINKVILSLKKSDFSDESLVYSIVFNSGMPAFEASLMSIKDHIPYPDHDREGFTLLFQTQQKNEYFEQDIYLLKHPIIGDLPLFMVPVGPSKEGFMQYEIVIS